MAMPKSESLPKLLVAQVQQPAEPLPAPVPVTPPQFYGALGVLLAIITAAFTIFAKTFPNYLERFFALKETEIKSRIEAEKRERESDLRQNENTSGTLNDFTRTLLANQLQSSRQFQEEVASILQLQNQQIGLILRALEDSSRNQTRFFEISDQIKVGLSDLKLEIEKNRKAINGKGE